MAAVRLFPPAKFPFRNSLLTISLATILCPLFYILGSNFTVISPPTQPLQVREDGVLCHDDPLQPLKNLTANYPPPPQPPGPPPLNFDPHHTLTLSVNNSGDDYGEQLKPFRFCPKNFTDYCPCHDPQREKLYPVQRKFHRERHCPGKDEKPLCLVPKPSGYRRPFPWPKSRDYAWFNNVPFKRLIDYKKKQNWVRLEGDRLVFPGGGTSFPQGVKGYVNILKQIVPLKTGAIRTVLDTGCGVASFGASLMDYRILTMSIAPRDVHEAQVQFALERGLPAMLGLLSEHRLPFPSRSFDMAHCSRCLVNWTNYDGMYLIEIDRLLRPGGYWVLSGPPINWRVNYKGWERGESDLEKEQNKIEELARRLCWKKVKEKGPIAVWQKPRNHIHCAQKLKTWRTPRFCIDKDPDAGWYQKLEACITPLPKVAEIHETSGGPIKNWPQRLKTAPPRVQSATSKGINTKAFLEDNDRWRRRVSYYGIVLKPTLLGRYRNIMDMNAGFGGFSAALSNHPVWVMNVVPIDAKYNTLGIVYERGLIGTYMDWCEAFSTEPRTYDLIHAAGVFSMYKDKCDIHDILFEVYRILRPGGAVIIRDHVDMIVKVKRIADRMTWNTKLLHSENGPFHPEKILLVDNNSAAKT